MLGMEPDDELLGWVLVGTPADPAGTDGRTEADLDGIALPASPTRAGSPAAREPASGRARPPGATARRRPRLRPWLTS